MVQTVRWTFLNPGDGRKWVVPFDCLLVGAMARAFNAVLSRDPAQTYSAFQVPSADTLEDRDFIAYIQGGVYEMFPFGLQLVSQESVFISNSAGAMSLILYLETALS